MKFGEIKNGQRHIKFFQVNNLSLEQIQIAKKKYEEFLDVSYPEIKNLPLDVRTFTYEVNENRMCFSSVYLEEQELLVNLKTILEEVLK